ncbi:MAG: GCN5-related N-acetyltransferase [Cyanobacteria bacterium RYN_339]|nr:GCN5-related N-acetyltransferase [Cyanobacteria bacterium RYN_339]
MIRCLGYRSDVALLAFHAEILEKPRYTVIRSPGEPGHYWGNFLLYPAPPGDLATWEADFKAEFPASRHRAFGWDDPTGALGNIAPFQDARYDVVELAVMATHTPAEVPVPDVLVRPIASDEDWEQVFQLQVLCEDSGHHPKEAYTHFKRKQLARYRAMDAAGLGHWWGAFVGPTLVADLCLFANPHGEARYQSVETHPAYRRRGICRYLVAEAARRTPADTYVVIALAHEPAVQVYASAGFDIVENQAGAAWWPELG